MPKSRTKCASPPAEGWEIVPVNMRPVKALYWREIALRLGRKRAPLINEVLERFGEPYAEGLAAAEGRAA